MEGHSHHGEAGEEDHSGYHADHAARALQLLLLVGRSENKTVLIEVFVHSELRTSHITYK